MTVEIRDLRGMAEFRLAEALQRAVWGEGDKEDPADLMMVIQQEGGLAAGAFQAGRLVGYLFGFPTRDPEVQHSHRLAVLAEARGLGLGARLKWYQRDWCLARGITRVRWTYDPVRLANASLNIGVLGAKATTYLPDYYGEMEGINAGTASDRLLADWVLTSARVVARAGGQPALSPDEAAIARRVPIPQDFAEILRQDPAAAQGARMAMRGALQAAFAEGFAVVGLDRETRDYLLLPEPPARP